MKSSLAFDQRQPAGGLFNCTLFTRIIPALPANAAHITDDFPAPTHDAGTADRFDHTLGWHSHLYCNCCGGVVDADVDEKQVMKLVRSQKGVVQDCAVVLFGLCEACAGKQAQ